VSPNRSKKIDTTTPVGKLIFHLMGALAEFERDLIRKRTLEHIVAIEAQKESAPE
jgi:DNA invertase Pin-like site-specific DNA recombinase